MAKYIFSKKGHDEFLAYYNRIKITLEETTREKSESGAGQDSWHDEGFKLGIGTEMMWSQRFGELQQVLMNCEIVDPLEQAEKVFFGNLVQLEDEKGNERIYLIDGYLVEPSSCRISYHSPLGKKLLGKTVGDDVVLSINGVDVNYSIVNIVLPSQVEEYSRRINVEQLNSDKF